MSISVEKLSFSYGSRRILQNITFTAQKGGVMSVLGPNGAGKSTLFRCILGLEDYFGKVLADGECLTGMTPRMLAKKIAYVPQSYSPSFNFTVLDMVIMGAAAQGGFFSSPGKKAEKLASEALEKLSISHLRNRGFMNISGGERQLTLIARAIAQNASSLIMDEPTSSLDYGNQLKVLSRIKSLSKTGYTVILSTHNPDHALLFADCALALLKGEVLAEGPACDVVTEENIFKLYGVNVSVEHKLKKCIPKEVID